MPETFNFTGDAVTFVGGTAVLATPILLYWIFRSYWNSPYNISVKSRKFVDAAQGTILTEDRDSNFPNENTVQN
jgi:hypothetical protein